MNEQFVDIMLRNCIGPAFREMALSYSVSTTNFYDTVHEYEYSFPGLLQTKRTAAEVSGDVEHPALYLRDDEVNKSNKRLCRLVKVLLSDANVSELVDEPTSVLFRKKVFDVVLEHSMLVSHNRVATSVGLHRVFSKADFVRAGFWAIEEDGKQSYFVRDDGSRITDTEKERLFATGYFFDIEKKERTAFAFPEFVVLSCLYLGIRSQTINVLNRPYETAKQKTAAKKRFREIGKVLFSTKYAEAVIRTIFDVLYQHVFQQLSETVEQHCREFWLDESHRNLKHFNYAMEKYQTDAATLHSEENKGYKQAVLDYFDRVNPALNQHLQATLKKREVLVVVDSVFSVLMDGKKHNGICMDPETTRRFNEECDRIELYSRFCAIVWPVAEAIALGYIPEMKISIPSEEILPYISTPEIDLMPYIRESNLDPRIKAHLESEPNYTVTVYDYKASCALAGVVRKYFQELQRAAAELLSCLPEASIAGAQDFFEYLQQLNAKN